MPNPTQQTQNDFELDRWLEEVIGDSSLTDQQRETLKAALSNEKVLPRLSKTVLTSRDYTRKTQALADQRKEHEESAAKLAADREALATWREGVQGQLDQVVTQYEQRTISEATARGKLEAMAARYGFDPASIADGHLPPDAQPTKGTKVADIDVSRFVTAEAFQKQFNDAKTFGSLVQAEIYDIAADHQELFGKPLKGARELAEKALKSNRPLRDIWAEENKVNDRRTDLMRESIRKEEHEKVEAELRQKYSEQALEGGGSKLVPHLPQGPVYEKFGRDAKDPAPLTNGKPEGHRVDHALKVFNEGLQKGEFFKQ